MKSSQIIVFLVFLIPLLVASCQPKSDYKIIYTVDRGPYFYIPAKAMTGDYHGILFPEKFMLPGVASPQAPIELCWHSTCVDGTYILTITPEQIFFCCLHENPNPNLLFWVMEIKKGTYQRIRNDLKANPPKGFVEATYVYKGAKILYTEEYQESGQEQLVSDTFCDKRTKSQIEKYFSILNSSALTTNDKIYPPETSSKGRLFYWNEKELRSLFPSYFARQAQSMQ